MKTNRTWTHNTYFELQHKIHSLFTKGVDVIEDESNDDVNAIAFMCGNAVLRNTRRQIMLHSNVQKKSM